MRAVWQPIEKGELTWPSGRVLRRPDVTGVRVASGAITGAFTTFDSAVVPRSLSPSRYFSRRFFQRKEKCLAHDMNATKRRKALTSSNAVPDFSARSSVLSAAMTTASIIPYKRFSISQWLAEVDDSTDFQLVSGRHEFVGNNLMGLCSRG